MSWTRFCATSWTKMESSASLIYRDGGLIYSEENDDLDAQGVIFTDLQTAVQRHPELGAALLYDRGSYAGRQ